MEAHVGPSGFVELTCISTIPAYLDDEEERFADKRIQTISVLNGANLTTESNQNPISDEGPKMIEESKPDPHIMEKYLFKNPAHKGVQSKGITSEKKVNTKVVEYVDHGMSHSEGGWPKDIDVKDDEAVLRFRKKVMRLENYVAAMKHLTVPMEHAILQNNAVNIYENYFEYFEPAISVEKTSCRVQNAFRDPNEVKRPITKCSWSPQGTQFAVTHCDMTYQKSLSNMSFASYVWDVENPNIPYVTLETKQPSVALEYNFRDQNMLAAGMYSGQVAHFDCRKGPEPVRMCPVEKGHRDPTHSVLWISSKAGAEFFSTSSDGEVKWWDLRKLVDPTESVILDLNKNLKPELAKSYASSCLEYEPSVPVKYMVGTENGYIICGNRKGITQQEKLPWIVKSHSGPIYAIHRNPAYSKNFLVVGDFTARIWSEDCKESSIIWTNNQKMKITDGEWSTNRFSVFFLTREDGVLDLWDILQQQEQACMSFKLSEEPLTCLRVREGGELVLTANSVGSAYVVRYSSNLATSSRNEKTFLSAMFDRENRREKLLETRNREIRFKMREFTNAKDSFDARREAERQQRLEYLAAVNTFKEALENSYLADIEATLAALEKMSHVAECPSVSEPRSEESISLMEESIAFDEYSNVNNDILSITT